MIVLCDRYAIKLISKGYGHDLTFLCTSLFIQQWIVSSVARLLLDSFTTDFHCEHYKRKNKIWNFQLISWPYSLIKDRI